MKRLILRAFLGMAALGLSAGVIQAGPFGGCGSGCGKCGANFCVRQYNAFSPACFGTVHCDGINPLGGSCIPGGYPSQPCSSCAMPWGMPGPAEGMHMPMPMPMHQPMPMPMPPPGGAPMPMLPPPGAQPLPMPQPAPGSAAMMGYPYYMQPLMMPNPLMPAAYGYPAPYGYQPAYDYSQPQQAAPANYPQQ
jgi:hypothetical protein